jgi:hypothetical protein
MTSVFTLVVVPKPRMENVSPVGCSTAAGWFRVKMPGILLTIWSGAMAGMAAIWSAVMTLALTSMSLRAVPRAAVTTISAGSASAKAGRPSGSSAENSTRERFMGR